LDITTVLDVLTRIPLPLLLLSIVVLYISTFEEELRTLTELKELPLAPFMILQSEILIVDPSAPERK
jgi:hypothetical protein